MTGEGAVLLCDEGRIWLDGKTIHLDTMEGDSVVVLGLSSGGALDVCAHRTSPASGFFARLRRRAAEVWVGRLGHGPASSLVSALLSGDRSGLPDGLRTLFRETGTTHILSVSGYHVGLVAALAFLVMGRRLRGRRVAAALLCSLCTGCYTLFSGSRPPAVRAAVMASAAILLSAAGIRASGTAVWALAAIAVMLLDPDSPGDAGAQMSFLAVLVLMTVRWRFAARWARPVQGLLTGVSITLGLAPLLVSLYGNLATASAPATVATTPLMAFTMLAGAATLLPAVWPPFARLADWSVFLWLGLLGIMRLPVLSFEGGDWWIPAWVSAMAAMWLVSERRSFPRRFF